MKFDYGDEVMLSAKDDRGHVVEKSNSLMVAMR